MEFKMFLFGFVVCAVIILGGVWFADWWESTRKITHDNKSPFFNLLSGSEAVKAWFSGLAKKAEQEAPIAPVTTTAPVEAPKAPEKKPRRKSRASKAKHHGE